MMTDLLPVSAGPSLETLQSLLLGGDLSKLTDEQVLRYYQATCHSLGLNPLTRPFDWIILNGKKTLYANKNCADQLRHVHNISIEIISREVVDDLYIVTARAKMPNGRHDEKIGAVPIANLKGESKANALMKCETKASRRVTLSIVGLSMLDETEVETIPGTVVHQEPPPPEPPKGQTPQALPEGALTDPQPAPAGAAAPTREAPAGAARDAGPRANGASNLDKPGLLKAIRAELTRLCGDSQQDMVDMARDTFGSAASSWKVVEQLPLRSLQKGLARLQAKPTPAQPSEEEDIPFVAGDASEDVSIMDQASSSASGDAQEENSFNGEETQTRNAEPEAARVRDSWHQNQGEDRAASQRIATPSTDQIVDPDANQTAFSGDLETPPESPRMQGALVDPADVGVLVVWAGMAGQQAILDKFCADKRMEHGLPVLPKITYQLIRTEVLRAMGAMVAPR